MPIYEFGCKECETITEVLKFRDDIELPRFCPVCGKPLNKIISKTSFQLKGNCWAKDGYWKGDKHNDSKEG